MPGNQPHYDQSPITYEKFLSLLEKIPSLDVIWFIPLLPANSDDRQYKGDFNQASDI